VAKKNRGMLVSIMAGLIAIILLLAVLVLHVVDTDTAMAGPATDHSTAHSAVTTEMPATTPQTMIMPDGSVMNMGDMPAAAPEDSGSAAIAEDSMAGMDMGGSVDWQVILLILALVAACVALGTGVNEYLRRQIAVGAFTRVEADCE
jgi:hypothetical protein